MKLYFGNTTAAVTTIMIVALIGFIGYSIWNRTSINSWGRRSLFVLVYGLVVCCFAAAIIILAAIATPIARSQHMREIWFYVMSGGVLKSCSDGDFENLPGRFCCILTHRTAKSIIRRRCKKCLWANERPEKEDGGMKDHGIKEETGYRNERYIATGDADSGLCHQCDQRDLWKIWFYFDRDSLFRRYWKSEQQAGR